MFSKIVLLQGVLISFFILGCATKNIPKNSDTQKPVVLFILDTSESMLNLEDGKPKIDKAKETILKTINKIDKDRFNTALVTFDKVRKCQAKKEIDILDPSSISNRIKNIKAWGVSPLADAIKLSNSMLSHTEKKMIILLSDGKDTCGKDPLKEAQKLYNSYGDKVNLQVIGYGAKKREQEELRKIATISRDWMYHDAKNSTAVNSIIKQLMPPKVKKEEIVDIPEKKEIPISIESNDDAKLELENFVFEFDTASANIKSDYILRVDELNSYLQNHNKKVLIIGHADARGTEEFNQKLSLKRAKSVRDKLIELGVDKNKIQIEGRGESEPIAPNDTKEGQKRNRRVEIQILD